MTRFLAAATAVMATLIGLAPASAATVCTVTVNSSDERDVLRTAFPDLAFVELTDYGTEAAGGQDWLEQSCLAGVTCDVLLVSGHFANGFFGDSGLKLPLRALEQRSCDPRCAGILKSPRLVFLLGCNTLASKHPDHRSPLQYRQVLLDDGLDPRAADRVVALRYAPLGQETRARMGRVFADGALVFGFSSTGPTGQVAAPLFKNFVASVRRQVTDTLARQPVSRQARSTLTRQWRKSLGESSATVVEGGPRLTADECTFLDPSGTRLERLRHAERLMREAPLRHALPVHDFLRESTATAWTRDEMTVLSSISRNQAVRREILGVLPRVADLPATYLSVLRLARRLEWLDESTFRRALDRELTSLLRDGVTAAEQELLCSGDLPHVPTAEVLSRNRGSLTFIETLPCLAARSASVRAFLLGHVSRRPTSVRVAALEALAGLGLLQPSDAGRLMALYPGAPGDVRASLLWGLAASAGSDLGVQHFIAAAAHDENPDVAWTSGQVLGDLRASDPDVLCTLATSLSTPDGFVRRGNALALESLAPRDAHVLDVLRRFRADADPVVRQAITHLLSLSTAARSSSSAASCVVTPVSSVAPSDASVVPASLPTTWTSLVTAGAARGAWPR